MSKLRILQLQSRYSSSLSDLGEQIASALQEQGYEVTTAFLKGSPKDEKKPSSFASQIHCFHLRDKDLKGWRRRFTVAKLRRYFSKGQFDFLIGHRFKPIHILLELNKTLKLPAMGIAHGFGDYDRRYRQKLMEKMIDSHWHFIGVSEPVKNYLTGLQCGFNQENTLSIDNAIDVDRINKNQMSRVVARDLLQLPLGQFIFGCIGRLVPVKGHIYLLEAFAKIKEACPNARLAIIGEGRERSNLEKRINELQLEKFVYLLGEKQQASDYLKAFDVFVLPSLSEGLPLVLLEAMTASLPLIGSDIPTIAPFLEGVGDTFPCQDASALSKVMSAYYQSSQEKLEKLGELAHYHVLTRHSLTRFKESYIKLVSNKLAKDLAE